MIVEKINIDEKRIKLVIDSLYDLLILNNIIIEVGDILRAKTKRRIVVKRGDDIKKEDLIPMILSIKVNKKKFENGRLRVSGIIVNAPEFTKYSYHTIEIKPYMWIEIIKKEINDYIFKELKKVSIRRETILIVCISRENITIGEINNHLNIIFSKDIYCEEEERKKFYKDVCNILKRERKKFIVCGPGFERENLLNFMKEEFKEMLNNLISFFQTGNEGKKGIEEAIKNSDIPILKNRRVTEEMNIINKFFIRLKKNEMVVYGKEDVERACDMGAVSNLIVFEKYIEKYEDIIKKAERIRADIHVVGDSHEDGQRFKYFEIAAFLRFKIF